MNKKETDYSDMEEAFNLLARYLLDCGKLAGRKGEFLHSYSTSDLSYRPVLQNILIKSLDLSINKIYGERPEDGVTIEVKQRSKHIKGSVLLNYVKDNKEVFQIKKLLKLNE